MGLLNPRARCPNCKGKIHVSYGARKAPQVCEHCGAELEGSDLTATLRVKGETSPWQTLRGGRQMSAAERAAIEENNAAAAGDTGRDKLPADVRQREERIDQLVSEGLTRKQAAKQAWREIPPRRRSK